MNPTVRATFQRVAEGTADKRDLANFKFYAASLGWEGVRGGGVVNHIEGARVKSYAALAALLLNANKREELEDVEEAEAEELEADARAAANWAESQALNLAEAEAARAENEAPGGIYAPPIHEEVKFVYYYTTRVPTVPISNLTSVDTYLTEEVEGGAPEGACQSGAALGCTGYGWLRVLPESMLPGSEMEQCIQCIPCHEASAAAYVRKLHIAEADS